MRHGRQIATVVLGLALALSAQSPLRAETAAEFFDLNTMQELRLRIHPRDLAEMRARVTENIFFPATVQWRGIRVVNVGVRMRGAGSRNPIKPTLLLDFTRYSTRQRFLGLTSLVLDNHWQDPTGARERMAMTFFTRMGWPAPRVASTRLLINDVYHGPYTIVENLDAGFLASRFADIPDRTNPGGFLYEYRNLDPYYFTFLGDSLATHGARFEARTRTKEADTTLYSALREFVTEVNGPYDAVWRSRVEKHIDLRHLVSYVAIENFLAQWDGFTGQWGMNNFYLYRPANSTQHRIIPWDADMAFGFLSGTIFERADQNVLFSRAVAFSDLRAHFLNVLEQCAQSALQGAWLENQTNAVLALVSDAAYNDHLTYWPDEELTVRIADLREFARLRPDKVLAEVAQARLAAGLSR